MAKLENEPATHVDVAQATVQTSEEARVQVGDGEVDNKAFMRIFLGKN